VARSDDGTPGQVCGFLVTLGYSRYAFIWLCLRQQRLEQVAFEETATFEQIVWDSPVSFDRARVREPFSPHWLASSRTSSSAVPSVGKTFLAHRTHQIAMEGPSLRAARAPSSPKGKRRTNESAASRG
jgi:hypothetical protein